MNWQEAIQQNIALNAQRALQEAQAAGDEVWIAQIHATRPACWNLSGRSAARAPAWSKQSAHPRLSGTKPNL